MVTRDSPRRYTATSPSSCGADRPRGPRWTPSSRRCSTTPSFRPSRPTTRGPDHVRSLPSPRSAGARRPHPPGPAPASLLTRAVRSRAGSLRPRRAGRRRRPHRPAPRAAAQHDRPHDLRKSRVPYPAATRTGRSATTRAVIRGTLGERRIPHRRVMDIDMTPMGDLRSRFRGPLLRLGDEGYREARAAWNLNAQQWPAAVVMAEMPPTSPPPCGSPAQNGSGSASWRPATASPAPCDGGVLVNTSRMRPCRVHPSDAPGSGPGRCAMDRRHPRRPRPIGLAGLPGSSSAASASSATRWAAASAGWGASSASPRTPSPGREVVTADGELVRGDAARERRPVLGPQGGGGNFGIVTAAGVRPRTPSTSVYAGNLFYPLERARDVLASWARLEP